MPDVRKAAIECQRFGAEGITVHPRPDERHIRYQDVRDIKKVILTEFNIEGYPSRSFLELVAEVRPDQVTLVPDPPDALTSSEGWNTIKHKNFLKEVIAELRKHGIRSSIFIDTNPEMIENAAETGCDRVELYTEPYARNYPLDPKKAVAPFVEAGALAVKAGLGLNAGHDLSLENLRYFFEKVEGLLEVSIGHALISDALYYGLENTIQMYRRQLQ
jgi:pyridoxine 5-phosphate synthase